VKSLSSIESVRLPRRRQAEIDALVRSIGFPLDPDSMYSSVLDGALTLTQSDAGSLVLVDEETRILIIPLTKGFSEETVRNLKIGVGEGVIGWVVQHDTPMIVPDTRFEPRFIAGDIDVRSEMAVPMRLGEVVIGSLDVNTLHPEAFSDEDARTLLEFATQMAPRVQNARLFGETQQRAEVLHALFDIGKSVSQTLDLELLLNRVVQHAVHIMEARIAALSLLSEDGLELVTSAVAGQSHGYAGKPPLPVSKSRIGEVIRTKLPVVVDDVQRDGRYQFADLARQEGLRSLLAVPLLFRDNVLGVLSIYKGHRHVFKREEVSITTSLADQAAIAIRNARLYNRLMNLEEQVRRLEKIGTAGEVAIGFAHEVRNPLTVIKMLLDSAIPLMDDDRSVISAEVNRLAAIVEQYLGYAKPDATRWQTVSLHETIRSGIRLLEPRASRQEVDIAIEFAEPAPIVLANPTQLEQVFVNLFLNAMDAMPKGGTLTVETGAAGSSVKVRVRDTGVGIPPEIQARLFEPFNTSKDNGVGLGLSIVRRIVGDHQGQIEAVSSSSGTCFTITLPLSSRQ